MNRAGGQLALGRHRLNWRPLHGWSGTVEYEGSLFYVSSLISQFINQKVPFGIEYNDGTPNARLIATVLDGQDGSSPENNIIDLWNLNTNDLEKSIFESPKAVPLGRPMILKVQKAANEALEKGQDSADFNNFPPDAQFLYGCLTQQKFLSFVEFQYVLQNRKILPPGVVVAREYYTLAGVVYTSTAKLVAGLGIPVAQLHFELPEGQWLVKGASTGDESDGKGAFYQEYWHADEWNSFGYPRRI